MLTRPQLKYVEENLMSALRKSTTQKISTTKLISGKMAMLLVVMTRPKQVAMMYRPRADCSMTCLR